MALFMRGLLFTALALGCNMQGLASLHIAFGCRSLGPPKYTKSRAPMHSILGYMAKSTKNNCPELDPFCWDKGHCGWCFGGPGTCSVRLSCLRF